MGAYKVMCKDNEFLLSKITIDLPYRKQLPAMTGIVLAIVETIAGSVITITVPTNKEKLAPSLQYI